MADLRIADAPEIDESEVQGGLKIPTGGFGNKAINMTTVASWVVKNKDLTSKGYVDDKFNQGNQGLSGHVANKNNPHEVTKEQVGLGSVDNTADADKPISNATSAALNLKADKTQLDLKADISRVDTIETYLEDSKALSQYDGKYEFDAAYAEKIGGYPLNARLMLSDGSIVQNTVAGNKTNPNVNMTGWEKGTRASDVQVGGSTLEVFASKVDKFKQPEAQAIEQDLTERAKIEQYSTDYLTLQDAFNVKRNNATKLNIPTGDYTIPSALNLDGVHEIQGQGDQTILRFAGAGNGIVYSGGSKFDDHAHRSLKNMRIRGDNTENGYVPKNGTTTGYSVISTGHFSKTEDITFDGHATGAYIQQNYTSCESHNYYRSNKVGLHLSRTTSYRIESIYARYNSDAALLITDNIQNLTIDGGAIEGNRGRGIWAKDLDVVATRASLNIDDLYMEGNGDLNTGIPSVDIQEVDRMVVNVRGGVFWLNVTQGLTSGVYKWGTNVVLDGASIAGQHYAKYMSIINRGATTANHFNTCPTEVLARLHGLYEPVLMRCFEPQAVRSTLLGVSFTSGIPQNTLPFTNSMKEVYPYFTAISAGVTSSEDTASDYGEGSFQKITIPDVGNYNTNYLELTKYDSTENTHHLFCFLLKPETDIELGFADAGGGTTHYIGYYKFNAGEVYKLIMLGKNDVAATNRVRMFSIKTGASAMSLKPLFKSSFKTRDECIGFLNNHCL